MGIVLAFAFFAAAVAATAFSIRRARNRARNRDFEELARQLGLSFSAGDSFGLLKQLKDFELFRRERRWIGRGGRIQNVLHGRVGDTEVFLFDYTYIVSTGKSARRITQTVFFANNTNWFLPDFKLKPETWWRKVLAAFGQTDINFPESPEFSDQFWVTGEFESLIRKTFSPSVQQFLANRPPVHLEGNNYYLLAYKPRRALSAAEAAVFFRQCNELVSVLQREDDKMELLDLADIQKAPDKMPLKAPKDQEE